MTVPVLICFLYPPVYTEEKIHVLSTLLTAASVTVVSNDECNKKRHWDGLIKPGQICAYNKKVSACLVSIEVHVSLKLNLTELLLYKCIKMIVER